MRKFYSLVLMAAALLIGTNAWAKEFSGTTGAELQNRITAIIYGFESDPVIKLQNDVALQKTIWVGTEKLSDPYKSITIDLNGNNITYNSGTANDRTLIALTHGELKIINTAANEATLGLTGNAKDGATIVSVYGSYKSSRWNENGTELVGEGTNTRVQGWCSHLEIGSNVKLYAEDGCQGTGLYIGTGTLQYPKADSTLVATAYPVSVMKTSGWGFAHGVRVDFSGKIEFLGTNSGKGYGIKANGTMRSPLSCVDDTKEGFNTKYTDQSKSTYIAYLANYYNNNADINTNASLATDATHKRDTVDAPFIWIHPGAEIIVRDAGSKVTALYAAGYAKWLVQGYAAGKTGMYVSAGVMDLNDAHVKSTAQEWESSTDAGSANGGGSGVVINSRSNYAGGVEFTVSGDTHIESIEGYAIEEIVNTTPVPNPDYNPEDPSSPETIQVTKVANITIEGGTISGGDEGAIVVSTVTLAEAEKKDDVEIVVYGGNVIGESYAGDKGAVTTGDLSDLMPSTGYHITEVVVDGKTTVVVSQGEEPATANSVVGAVEYTAIKWQNTSVTEETISVDKVLTELEMNESYAQTLTIAPNHKLTVGHIILGENAKIIVKPGAKLIITASHGINANIADNIILESSAAAQAILLFSPAVKTNRQPEASVKMYVEAGKDGSDYLWTRFAMPIQELDAMKREHNYTTYIYGWNYTANQGKGDWEVVTNMNDFKAWAGYTLTYENEGDQVYTFEGNLVGNSDAALNFVHRGYNYFGNSYSSYIDAKTLVQALPAEIDAAIYMWDVENQVYAPVAKNTLINGDPRFMEAWQNDIAPMTTFILRLMDLDIASADVNYENAIWKNPRHGNAGSGAAAPKKAPAMRNEDAFIGMVVTAANGKSDRIRLLESADYTDAYERGYDVAKFMNTNMVNLYASINGENYSNVFTNSLEGKEISMQTMDDVNYTISFENVEGTEYSLLDKATNIVTEIANGAIYEFSAQPNSVVEGRFEIIDRHNAPTALENTEVKANVKGIYTIMGQYLGEDFEVLPAGVYVVNGVKVVK